MQLTGAGTIGDGTLEGNEESLTTYSDAVVINQLRHAVRSAGRMSQQRVPFSSARKPCPASRTGGPTASTCRASTSFAVTVQVDVRYTGMNATTAPDTGSNGHYLNAHSTASISGHRPGVRRCST
jgi:hypothetical protein